MWVEFDVTIQQYIKIFHGKKKDKARPFAFKFWGQSDWKQRSNPQLNQIFKFVGFTSSGFVSDEHAGYPFQPSIQKIILPFLLQYPLQSYMQLLQREISFHWSVLELNS